jgi:hypothetical protein
VPGLRPLTVAVAVPALLLARLSAAAPPEPATPPDYARAPRSVPAPEGPQGELPPPPPRGRARTASAAVAAGPGWLALRDRQGRDGQWATSVAGRLGVVPGPEWNLLLGFDHARTDRGGATFSQTAFLVGAQHFFARRIYLGAALGMAFVKESGVSAGLTDGPGGTLSSHLGVEALRLRHAALTVEASFSIAEYNEELWEMGGLRLGVTVF